VKLRRLPAPPNHARVLIAASVAALLWACGAEPCGPRSGEVARIVDGDTIILRSGATVRYLLIDTPETTDPPECYGIEAREANRALVAGKAVQLRYDVECEDRYGRLLAYVDVDGSEANRVLVARGFACAQHIPPNGAEEAARFEELEAAARDSRRGLWGACVRDPPC
jgi:micrococcal nuclease